MSNLTNIIQAGLNNPECAFYVGQWFGWLTAIKWVFVITILLWLIRALEIVFVEQGAEWVKKKLFGGKRK